jgi:hypothetical protein
MLKKYFDNIKVYNSHEYIHCNGVANILGVTYDSESYESYVELAQSLFAFIVRTIKNQWPTKYQTCHGHVYSVKDDDGTVTYPQRTITDDLAMRMGIIMTERNTELQLLAEQSENIKLRMQLEEVKRRYDDHISNCANKNSTHTPIIRVEQNRIQTYVISRDIITGDEATYNSAADAANALGLNLSVFENILVNKTRQIQGKTWRTEGHSFWVPPATFIYDPNVFVERGELIQAANGKDIHVYEGAIQASNILGCSSITLARSIDKSGLQYVGYTWTRVVGSEADGGKWVMSNDDSPLVIALADSSPNTQPLTEKIVIDSYSSGINGRCAGKIISRDLKTGNEVTYDNITCAAKTIKISPACLVKFVDKPRQVKGRHWRTFYSNKYWNPPPYFKYDPDSFVSKTNGYIIAVSVADNTKTMYESKKSAQEIEGIQGWGVSQYKDSEMVYEGRRWRLATEAEYNTYTTCPPQAPQYVRTLV